VAFFKGVHDFFAACKIEQLLVNFSLNFPQSPSSFLNYKKTIPSIFFTVKQGVAAWSRKVMGKDEQRLENRETHRDYLWCANENASSKTLVSSIDREALTTATSSAHRVSMTLQIMKPSAGQIAATCDRQKVHEFCSPTLQSFPDFLQPGRIIVFVCAPGITRGCCRYVYGACDNMGAKRRCSAISHQI
jgi:hypothetical protein